MAQTKKSNNKPASRNSAPKPSIGTKPTTARAGASSAPGAAQTATRKSAPGGKASAAGGKASAAGGKASAAGGKAPVAAKAGVSKAAKPKKFETHLEIGDKAPPFTLRTADGGKVALADLRKKAERGVIVFFYPAAGTPACTKEACDFRDSLSVFTQHGYLIVGISPDATEKNAGFAAQQKLSYPLATDNRSAVARKYGAWGKKPRYQRAHAILPPQVGQRLPHDDGPLRATFVIDKAGKIAYAATNVQADGHVGRLRKALRIDR